MLNPKIKNPTKITQLYPISLSNVISRIASKVLANRLRYLFPKIISENQSVFMSECLITDNVLVAFETMHHIIQKRIGKVGEMAIKLDISKTYDRVEWGCLEKIMLKMGFHVKWVDIMMRCICSISYSIKINGRPWGHITPTQGLHQGDHLSPYLFFICAEGLLAMLKKAVVDGQIKRVAACSRGLEISHLFFINDSLIFCWATREDYSSLENTLKAYEIALGQQLNREKTVLFFSSNTPQDIQDDIKQMFGLEVIHQHETYLGLPSLIGKSKSNTF